MAGRDQLSTPFWRQSPRKKKKSLLSSSFAFAFAFASTRGRRREEGGGPAGDADPRAVRVRRGGVPGVGHRGGAGRGAAAAVLLRPHPGPPHRPPLRRRRRRPVFQGKNPPPPAAVFHPTPSRSRPSHVSIDSDVQAAFTFTVGYHELAGTKVALKKPLLVLRKKKTTAVAAETELEVIGVIRHKILFKDRPKALISSNRSTTNPSIHFERWNIN